MVVAEVRVSREQQLFERDLARHTATLMNFAKPYIGRLSGADRDAFLSGALSAAWTTRSKYQPDKENASLLLWWEKCLRAAALTRQWWRCSTFDRKFEMVLGTKLGRELL